MEILLDSDSVNPGDSSAFTPKMGYHSKAGQRSEVTDSLLVKTGDWPAIEKHLQLSRPGNILGNWTFKNSFIINKTEGHYFFGADKLKEYVLKK
jgi:hypothetical protein